MDITFPRSRLAQLINIAGIAFAGRLAGTPETDCAEMVTTRAKQGFAPMRRREFRPNEFAGTDVLLARAGPLGPYLGALRR
jgi:hypothetical protein